MAKVTRRENYRVIVEPSRGWFSAQYAADVRDKINEHARSWGIDARVESDVVTECGFCRTEWEVDGEGCPTCCDDAQAEWEAAQVQRKEVR